MDFAYCRLCKKPETNLYPIDPFVDYLGQMMSIFVTANDELSKSLCGTCNRKIRTCCTYKKFCRRNQTISRLSSTEMKEVNQVKKKIVEDDEVEIFTKDITTKINMVDNGNREALTSGTLKRTNDNCLVKQVCDVEFIYQAESEPKKEFNIQVSSVRKRRSSSSQRTNAEKKQFLNGLGLITIDTNAIEREDLSALENSYLQKCMAMIQMYNTLKCSCHFITFYNLKSLFSHLRSTKRWFPIFTCFNCMITFSDSASSRKHIYVCPKNNLDGLVQLSKLKNRSRFKTRIYQNFRCTKCHFIFTFHEDFCEHISKAHHYDFCMIEYYCDICNFPSRSLQDFIDHAQEIHDNWKGSVINQEGNIEEKASVVYEHKAKNNNSKKRRNSCNTTVTNVKFSEQNRTEHEFPRSSINTPIEVLPISNKFNETEPNENKKLKRKKRSSTHSKGINGYQTDDEVQRCSKYSKTNRDTSTTCPQCGKSFFSHSNVLRHLRIHQESNKEGPKPPQQNNCNKTINHEIEYTNYKNVLRKTRSSTCLTTLNNDQNIDKEQRSSNILKNSNCNQISCTQCPEVFSGVEEFVRHFRIHLEARKKETKNLQQETCNEAVGSKDVKVLLRNRTSSVHSRTVNKDQTDETDVRSLNNSKNIQNDWVQCSRCSKEYSSVGYMERHFRTYTETEQNELKPLQIETCNEIASHEVAPNDNKEIWKKRSSSVRGREVYKDHINDRGQPNLSNSKHCKKNRVQCLRCPKMTSSIYNIRRHLKTHQEADQKKVNFLRQEN